VTGPGLAGSGIMGTTKNNKSTAKVTPTQLAMIQKDLLAKEKEKQKLSQVTRNKNVNIHYDSTKQLSNNTEGEKYLIIHRLDDNKTMRDISPILLETAIKNATQNGSTECKFLKSGDILIKAKTLRQAQNLIKITGILDAKIQVTEHKTMNSCKGVIRAYELKNEDSDTLLEYLKEQKVTDIKMLTSTINGHTTNTGVVFVTFGVNVLPEYLTIGLLRVRVRPYIPTPMRCFACHKFGHLSKHCTLKDSPTCYNCNNTKHIHNKEDKCTNPAFCVNCGETSHNSYNRNCKEYRRQVEIQTIRVTQNVSMAEAVKRSNMNRVTYAQVTTAQTENDCKCQHCNYHNKKDTAVNNNNNNNKRPRPPRAEGQELTTDEETFKKKRVQSATFMNDEDEEEEMIT
jgi:hypothetical protein